MEVTINKKNLELIKRISTISEVICRLHVDLCDFETLKIEGSPDSPEKYKETLDNIKLAEEIESNLFKEIDLDEADDIIAYLITDCMNVDFADDIKSIIEDENLLLCIRRMSNRIAINRLAKDSIYKNIQNNPYFINMTQYPDYFAKYKYCITQEQDTINRFIHYLDEEAIKNPLYARRLMECKYFVLFVTERYFSGIDRFTCDRFVTSTASQGKILGITPQNIKKLDDEYNSMRYIEVTKAIIRESDTDLIYTDNIVKNILRKCFLKAILTGYSYTKLEEIRTAQFEKFGKPEYKELLKYHYESRETIETGITEAIRDKQKIIVKEINHDNTF